MPLSENRPPRAPRPTPAKKTSRVGLRDIKITPTKPPVKLATEHLNLGDSSPKSAVGGTVNVRRISAMETVSRSPMKPTLVTALPLKRSIRTEKGISSVKADEKLEEKRALANAAEAITKEDSSDHSCHSHPVLKIGGLSEATIHIFTVAKSKAKSQAATPPIPSRNPRREQVSTDFTDADDEESDPGNLSDAIRSALATPGIGGSNLHRAQTPSSVKSVRWALDPAIAAYGRVISGTNLELPPSSPPHFSPIPKPKPKAVDFTEALGILSELKKEDQEALLRLLVHVDVSSNSDDVPIITQSPRREETKERTGLDGMFAKKLNPKAPVFRDHSRLKKQVDQQMQGLSIKEAAVEEAQKAADEAKMELDQYKELMADSTVATKTQRPVDTLTPRKGRRMEALTVEKMSDPQRPTSFDIFNPPSEDMPHGFSRFTNNPLSSKVYAPVYPPFPPHTMAAGFHGFGSTGGLPDFSRTVWVPLQMLQTPFGFHSGIPALPQPGHWGHPIGLSNQSTANEKSQPAGLKDTRRPHKTKAGRGPLVDVASQIIPPDFGPCRIAQPVAQVWGQSLLDKFTAKYPQTGKVNIKAKKKAPGQMRQAAAIQQELELLIYQEKEKEARNEKFGIVRPKAEKKETAENPEKPMIVKSIEGDRFSCPPVQGMKGCLSVPLPVLTMPAPANETTPAKSWEHWW